MVEARGPEAPQVNPVVRPPLGLTLRWPTTATAWAGLAIMIAADAWLIYNKQTEAVAVLTGLILNNLGLTLQQSTALSMAVAATTHASRAADAAADAAVKTDDRLSTLTEAVRDIQENPAQPGTAGWMERNAPPN